MISDEFLQELRLANDIESVVSSYVVLKRRGRNLVGLCPFHSEKTGSFTLYPENGSFYCFGCGAGGDVITFIRRIENLGYVEAVRLLAERAGMNMPEDVENDAAAKQKSRILSLNREAARYFHDQLMSPAGEAARAYLEGRQMTRKTVRHFGLGFAPAGWDGLLRHLKSLGYSEEEMLAAAVVSRGRNGSCYDLFRNRIMFPIIDLRGGVVGFSGRQLDDKGPKYINSADTPVYKKSRLLFALNFAKSEAKDRVILCEGNVDVIMLHQAGFTNAVAALGTSLTAEQARLIAQYTEEVVLAYDSDGAGQKATTRASGLLSAAGLRIRILRLEGAKDPDEYIKRFGAGRFKQLLEGADSANDFALARLREQYNLETEDGRVQYLKKGVDLIAAMHSPLERDIYAARLAKDTGATREAVNLAVTGARKRKSRAEEKSQMRDRIQAATRQHDAINPERGRHMRAARAEEMLISVLLRHPDFYGYIRERIAPQDFVTAFNAGVYERLCSRLAENRPADIGALSADYGTDEMGRIMQMANLTQGMSFSREQTEEFIDTIFSEKQKQSGENIAQMDDAHFAAYLKARAGGKKGEE